MIGPGQILLDVALETTLMNTGDHTHMSAGVPNGHIQEDEIDQEKDIGRTVIAHSLIPPDIRL